MSKKKKHSNSPLSGLPSVERPVRYVCPRPGCGYITLFRNPVLQGAIYCTYCQFAGRGDRVECDMLEGWKDPVLEVEKTTQPLDEQREKPHTDCVGRAGPGAPETGGHNGKDDRGSEGGAGGNEGGQRGGSQGA